MSQKALIKSFDEFKNAATGLLNPQESPDMYQWKVLAEGDSWFHLNGYINFNENLLHGLRFNDSTYIVDMAMSGDAAQDMVGLSKGILFNQSRVNLLSSAANNYVWDFFLISAGGNDLIDAFVGEYEVDNGEKVTVLKSCESPFSYLDFIDLDGLEKALNYAHDCIGKLIRIMRNSHPNQNKKVIMHTYDYFTLRNKKSNKSIRQQAMESKNVPLTYWKPITALMNDRLAEMLLSFNGSDTYPNVIVIDTRSCLVQADEESPGKTKHWRNEIHPNFVVYEKIGTDRLNAYLFP